MESSFSEIRNLLRSKAEYLARLELLPYDGTPEIKTISGNKYLYIRKRVLGRLTSQHVGVYSDELYNLLLRNAQEAKEIRRNIRKIEKRLAELNYSETNPGPRVVLNLEFARSNMKTIIYDQAILEGISTTFPDTEEIINNGIVRNMSAGDVQKILNLKRAWEFILDRDVISAKSDYYLASYIAKLVNEGFFQDGGRIRGVPVTIGGSSYIPPLPVEYTVREEIDSILERGGAPVDTAIELCLYVMKKQIYNDGNKRTAVIYANHYLISRGGGLLVIPYEKVQQFREALVLYYEDRDTAAVKSFLKDCWMKLD